MEIRFTGLRVKLGLRTVIQHMGLTAAYYPDMATPPTAPMGAYTQITATLPTARMAALGHVMVIQPTAPTGGFVQHMARWFPATKVY
jgi:hypothetical protein